MGTLVAERIRKTIYDDGNDILYINFTNYTPYSYADDGPVGIEIMRSMETNEAVGLVIYYPKGKQKDRQEKLKNMGYNFQIRDFIQ